jgi:hypothetical protein
MFKDSYGSGNNGYVDARRLRFPSGNAGYNSCYQMFENSGLRYAPAKLSPSTLSGGCYERMFRNNAGLLTTPKLPATTLN